MPSSGLGLLLFTAAVWTVHGNTYLGVTLIDGEVREVAEGWSGPTAARAWFKDALNYEGWTYLKVSSNPDFSNEEQAYAAGYVEGKLTAPRIYQHAVNMGTVKGVSKKVQDFLDRNHAWIQAQVESNPSDPYWIQVSLIYRQIDGIVAGYNDGKISGEDLSANAIMLISLYGDLEDLEGYYGDDTRPISMRKGHCSALVRLPPDNGDLFFAHNTWTSLNSMLRMYKLYEFPFKMSNDDNTYVPAVNVSFPSYPASVLSRDDFYVMSSGLVAQETTISIYNETLYDEYLAPESVLEFVRTMVANRLATSAPQWGTYFAKFNSGTYNNNWMIVDYNKFTPGRTPPKDTFWVVEQVPGYVESADQTDYLVEHGYYASYNVPFYAKTFNMTGSPEQVKEHGEWFSYTETARAKIFRRDVPKATDLRSIQSLMRYNDFKHDPLSRCNCTPPYTAENAIAARDDLNPADGVYPIGAFGQRNHAAIDAKIISYSRMRMTPSSGGPLVGRMDPVVRAISGPTYDQQPVFVWSASPYKDVPHEGLPDVWKFPWVDIEF